MLVSESLFDFAVGLDDDVGQRIVLGPFGRLQGRLRGCTARRARLFVDHAPSTCQGWGRGGVKEGRK